MALNVIGNYFAYKSIKLSDAFAVYIKQKKGGKEQMSEYPECTSFTIPKFEQEEDTMIYGNTSQTFLIPKYDSCREMSLTFYESLFDGNSKLDFIRNNASYNLTQKFDGGGLAANLGTYHYNMIDTILIKVANNVLHKFVYAYEFKNLKVINYSLYNLDNQTDAPCQITVNFAFESFRKYVLDEDIIQIKKQTESTPQPTQTEYVPNGKVEAAPIDPKQIEANWQGQMNEDDLDMIRNEELINPLYGELPDLDDESESSPEITTEMWKQETNKQDLDMNNNELMRPEVAELEDLELDDTGTEKMKQNTEDRKPELATPVENKGATTGGDKQPALGGGSDGHSETGGSAAANAAKKAQEKANTTSTANNKESQSYTKQNKEKTYAGGMTASELGTAAAQYDKKNGGDMYKNVVLGQLGTDASERNKFNAAYNEEKKRK